MLTKTGGARPAWPASWEDLMGRRWVEGPAAGGRRERFGPRLMAIVALILASSVVTGAPAVAQSDEDAGTYVSPTFGYALGWDPDDWTVEDEREPTGQSTRDFLRLHTNDADRDGLVTGIVFVEGTDQDWSDPDDCVRTLAREIDVRPSRDEPIPDPETGDPYEISGDDRSAAAYVRVFEDDDGNEATQAAMLECRADPDSDLIVAFTNVSVFVDTYFDRAYPQFAALVDSLTLPGSGGDDRPDKGNPPAASDGPRPDKGNPPTPSDEAGPTAEPSDAPTAEASDDPTSFVADDFGVELTWDPTVWTFENEERGEGYAAVRLSSELLTSAVVPYTSGDGSVQTCLANYVAILNERGAGTAAIVVRPDGQQDIATSEDGGELEAFVAYTEKDVPLQSRIVCRSLGPTDVLAIEFTGPADELRGDEARQQIGGLLAGLRIRA